MVREFTKVDIETEWGARLTVLREDASHYGDVLTSGVSWEHETRILRRLTGSGATVLDVGANYGYTASLFAHHVGPSGRVVSVEPEPVMAGLLERNMAANGHGNVDIVTAAVGSVPGNVRLWRSATNLACHAVNPDLVPAAVDSVTVPVTTLDLLCAERLADRAADLLKLDVEGWELVALHGARNMLEAARPDVWLEFWPDGLRANGHKPAELLELLRAAGYELAGHDLVTGEEVSVAGDAAIDYCDAASESLRAQGATDLYGIVYLLATHPGRDRP
ncbi:FkbM family methyltransferase [Streptomyces sp. TP-A0874]|uniref:FkbM family methyltransferase n=1 Tax=Streptomyces sp. TP-A0874 TaxID=549819 RepID=UPI00085349F3|nr:FkbM family methyltransferase [Streptomyces sp. TP-A0874]